MTQRIRLAVDQTQQGRQLGKYLLIDAMRRSVKLSQELAILAIVVDVKDEAAATYCQRFGFIRTERAALRLFLMVDTAAQVFAQS